MIIVPLEGGRFRIFGDNLNISKFYSRRNYELFEVRECLLSSGADSFFSSSMFSKIIKTKTYRTIVFPFVLYGCETWSLTLRGERRLRVFENRVLRRVFGPKKDEVTGEWRKLHNEELSDLYSLPNIVPV